MAFDTNYSDVTLWLQNAIRDSSPLGWQLSVFGDTQISSTESYRGGASILFDGVSGDYLTAPTNSSFAFGTGDFTVEFWVKFTVIDGSQRVIYDGRSAVGSNAGVCISVIAGALRCDTHVPNAVWGGSLTAGPWYHVALTKTPGLFRLWLNGVLVGSEVNNNNLTDGKLIIGDSSSGGLPFGGYINDFRITKGVARYTATFDPTEIAYETYGFNSAPPAPTLVAYGGGGAELLVTAPFVYAGIQTIGELNLTAPSPTLSSYGGGNLNITVPRPRLNFTAHGSYGDNAAFVKPPKITVSAYGGGRAALTAPSPNLTSTATGTALAVANLTAPSPTVASEGTVSNVANISITIPGPNVRAYAGAVCSVTIAGVTVQATGTGGGVAHAAITIPLFQLDAQGTAQNHGGANISAPMPVISTGGVARLTIPMATLTVIGTATVVATYEAYALNLKHTAETNDEVTHYTNFPFTHIVRYKDRYYGANTTGLYLLEGTTDDGMEIPFAIETAKTDFKTPEKKTISSAYFGGRIGPAETVTLVVGESGTESYAYTTPRSATPQNHRQAFGRGVKARYYAIGVAGTGVFELDTIDLNVDQLTRRI